MLKTHGFIDNKCNTCKITIKIGSAVASGRASNSEPRGPGFDPHKRHRVVSLSKTH